ncbi:MAG: hypothetical protein HYX60_02190 [Legionella longbeachae]|nr:hypothetical protein [Legionella longbeachae]
MTLGKINKAIRRLVIQDKAVIAEFKEDHPIGEAGAGNNLLQNPMTFNERLNMVRRLKNTIIKLMDKANKTYQKNCYKPETAIIDPDYITRLSTNEFFFYTKEPLTLEEFTKLQNELSDKAKTLPCGIHLILSSFAVKTLNNEVMNVTPHITCGKKPEFNFIVKNHTSRIDFRYKILNDEENTVTLSVLDKSNASPSMPKIIVDQVVRQFTFNNIIPCKTPGGTPFLTAVDICLDHKKGVAKTNIKALANKKPAMLRQPISHVVVSNSIKLQKELCLESAVMHVDPHFSRIKCKIKVAQQQSSVHKLPFGTNFTIMDLEPIEYSPIQNIYAYTSSHPTQGRYHLHKASTAINSESLKFYSYFRGDYLKTKILKNFSIQILKTSSQKELLILRKKILKLPEYTILKTGQGFFTRTTNIETTSIKALKKMFKIQEKMLRGDSCKNKTYNINIG